MSFDGYDPIAVAVFAFLAMITQVPVFLAQTLGPVPNMPIAVITLWFLYLNISTFINSIMFNADDYTTWWAGEGWCDVDTNLTDASALGITLAALVISCHLLYASKVTTKRMTETQLRYWRVFDVAVCSVIPIVSIVLHTFMTLYRYSIVQGVGCRQVMTLSTPVLIFHTVIPLVVALLLLVVNFITLLQFFTRGKESVYQALSFKERFSINFYWRTTICCTAIIVTCVPLSIYNAVQNITSSNGHISPFPWIHGKPNNWEQVLAFPWGTLESTQKQTVISSIALKVMIIFLSFVSFFCFGTGSAAISFYRDPLKAFRSEKIPERVPDSADDEFYFTNANKVNKDDIDINIRIKEYVPSP